ncbi:uncharacterized protein LOC129959534 [Argiope bruennichi]|uniref:uncharacterized protein LOC129959534 n=1 Tax=Argiope bruennichi TaxID=94029 RepID=UPI0024946413|nr:uncharacterized protein LOC129959534 [Argiope bruennichi]
MESKKLDALSKTTSPSVSKPVQKLVSKGQSSVSFSKISRENEQKGAIPKNIKKTDLPKGQPNMSGSFSKISNENLLASPIRVPKSDSEAIQKSDMTEMQPNVVASSSKVRRENEKRGAIPKCIQKTDLPKRQPNIAASFSKMNLSNENFSASPIRIPQTDSEEIEKSDLTEVQPNVVASSSKKSKFAEGGRKKDTCQSSEPSTSLSVAEQMEAKRRQEKEDYMTKKWLEGDKKGWEFLGKGSSDIEFPIEPPPDYEGHEVLGVKLDRLEAWAEKFFK